MDQVAVIRHKVENEEKSLRSVAKELGISRNMPIRSQPAYSGPNRTVIPE